MRIDNKIQKEMKKGLIGIEKENVRVDHQGRLALTSHPTSFGKKDGHPYIQADFSESQVEMITPPLPSIEEAYYFLENIHDVITVELEDEYLWPSSMPPILPEDELDIPIAVFENETAMNYRRQLAEKYGRRRQLICGVHANISFTDEFFKLLAKREKSELPFREFRDEIYLKMARGLLRFSNFLFQKTGASPIVHETYNDACVSDGKEIAQGSYYHAKLPSIRNSKYGYTNNETLEVSFENLSQYIADLEKWVNKGYIQNEKEFYCPVRLKSHGDSLPALENNGIDYLEIRLLDLDPTTKVGISKRSLYLIRTILLMSAFKKVTDDSQLLNELLTFTREWNLGVQYEDAINSYIKEKNTISAHVVNQVKNSDFISYHLQQAKLYKEQSLASQFQFAGGTELELSTQILLRDCIRKGLMYEFLDRNDHFIAISDGNKTEYVKQATKTSLDSYSTVLAMGNKHVTKQIVAKKNLNVPIGEIFYTIDEALESYENFAENQIVIKPNSTNFGIGITIFPDSFTKEEFNEAVKIAFSEDDSILIEHYYPGKEYRFLVINGEVVGVLYRIPANVMGDGVSSIRELVADKNTSSLRGTGYTTPLEKIKLGQQEELVLNSIGKSFDSVPEIGEIVYLRENSNISTGGDSIDLTDYMHSSYKDIAIQAAAAVDATICGVDIIVKDKNQAATDDNYTIIELNYNPAIHIHCFPFRGKNRQAGEKVLQALFPDLNDK